MVSPCRSAFCALTLILPARFVFADPEPIRQPVIDMHAHCYTDAPEWKTKQANPVTGKAMVATDSAAHQRISLAEMRRLNIVKAMVSGDLESVQRWEKEAPDRVIGGIVVEDPTKIDFDLIRREYKAGHIQVIGEVATQYGGIPPNDPRMEPLYALAEELDLPVALHMHPGPPGVAYEGSALRARMGEPLLLEDVLVRHPKMRIYVMHAGWPFLDQMIALLYAHPQVYVDIAVVNWTQPAKEFQRYLRTLVEAGYGRRIMFGSDQMVWPEAFEMALKAIDDATFLTAEQKGDILYHNAARFLRLEAPKPGGPPGSLPTLSH
jgi:hypothetical protein